MSNGVPSRVTAVGCAGDANFARLGDATRNEGFNTRADVVLFTPAPTVDFDGLGISMVKACATAIIWIKHIKALGHEKLNLVVQ